MRRRGSRSQRAIHRHGLSVELTHLFPGECISRTGTKGAERRDELANSRRRGRRPGDRRLTLASVSHGQEAPAIAVIGGRVLIAASHPDQCPARRRCGMMISMELPSASSAPKPNTQADICQPLAPWAGQSPRGPANTAGQTRNCQKVMNRAGAPAWRCGMTISRPFQSE